MIESRHISFAYHQKNILKDISFYAECGQMVSLLGPNGTGKTTLLKCLLGLLPLAQGQIWLNGKDVQSWNIKERARKMAYVPQSFSETGLSSLSVIETILMGRIPYIQQEYTRSDQEKAFQVIQKMGLEEFAFRDMNRLSGGERQRVFIARAITQEAEVIFLDEPTSSLDLKNQLLVLQTIEHIVKEKHVTAIMTMHDINLASLFSNKIILLKEGQVFASGVPKEVLLEENIQHVYQVHTNVVQEEGYKYIHLQKS